MKVHKGLQAWTSQLPVAATLGNFDGVHLGHQQILQRLLARAREVSIETVALTFDPVPKKILDPASAPPLIQTLEQRLRSIAEHGIEHTIVMPFDHEFAQIEPE